MKNQLVNVSKIVSSGEAFAALRNDGSVVTWGYFEGIALLCLYSVHRRTHDATHTDV